MRFKRRLSPTDGSVSIGRIRFLVARFLVAVVSGSRLPRRLVRTAIQFLPRLAHPVSIAGGRALDPPASSILKRRYEPTFTDRRLTQKLILHDRRRGSKRVA